MSVQPSAQEIRPGAEAFRLAVEAYGTAAALAEALGISPQALSQWEVVPVGRVIAVEALTGVSRATLRPDIFGPDAGLLASLVPNREANVAARLRAVRKSLGVTQAAFADEIGVSQAAVCRWETAEAEPEFLSSLGLGVLLGGLLERRQPERAAADNAHAGAMRTGDRAGFLQDDTLDAARDDLGDATGLLIALNQLASEKGTDNGEAIASVARCALEKVRAAYRSVSDAWEAQS